MNPKSWRHLQPIKMENVAKSQVQEIALTFLGEGELKNLNVAKSTNAVTYTNKGKKVVYNRKTKCLAMSSCAVTEFLEQTFGIPTEIRKGIGPTSGLSYKECLWRRYMQFWHKKIDLPINVELVEYCTDQGFEYHESSKCAKLLTAMANMDDKFSLQMCKEYADHLMYE